MKTFVRLCAQQRLCYSQMQPDHLLPRRIIWAVTGDSRFNGITVSYLHTILCGLREEPDVLHLQISIKSYIYNWDKMIPFRLHLWYAPLHAIGGLMTSLININIQWYERSTRYFHKMFHLCVDVPYMCRRSIYVYTFHLCVDVPSMCIRFIYVYTFHLRVDVPYMCIRSIYV